MSTTNSTVSAEDIRRLRLRNQRITAAGLASAEAAVAHMGAMQAQEYGMARWAVGLRMADATDDLVEEAFQQGRILRTHLLRPTWHFVAPADIRWLLSLTAPHVHKRNAPYYKKWGLSPDVLANCLRVLEKAINVGAPMTRPELAAELARQGVEADSHRLAYIMMFAELEGLICSGPRRGKRFTYMLLDKAAPLQAALPREEALARLARRYFTSRGPATVQDFATWSGLPVADVRLGAELLGSTFCTVTYGGAIYHTFCEAPAGADGRSASFLMPDYDEYGMGYRDRSHLEPERPPEPPPSAYSHWLVLGGRLAGTWAREKSGIMLTPFTTFTADEEKEAKDAANRYLKFKQGETLRSK